MNGKLRSMPTLKAKSARKPARRLAKAKASASAYFWIRPENPELDRSGEYLLANLGQIRREAPARATTP
jgi:hypothetical protein